jgi:hypothetical protein
MDMKHGRLYVSISLIIYIAILATLALLFNLAEKKALANIDADFNSLGKLTASARDMGGDFSAQTFSQQLVDRYQNTPSLQCFLVSATEGETRFCIPADSVYLEAPEENPSLGTEVRRDKLKVPVLTSAVLREQSIRLSNGDTVHLSAAYTLITRNDLTAILLWGLALTMAALLVHLLILSRNPSESQPEAEGLEPPEEDFPSVPEADDAAPYSSNTDYDDFTVPDFSFPSAAEGACTGEEAEIQDAVIHLKPFAAGQTIDENEVHESETAYDLTPPEAAYDRAQPESDFTEPSGEIEAEEEAPAAKAALTSLFSAESGICLEAFLQERLTYELLRADHRGVDCALVFIGKDGTMSAAEYAANAQLLTDFFISKDLVFERAEGQYAIILPGTDIDAAFSEAVKYLRMARELAEAETGPNPWYMGISARGDREVDSGRLLAEAANALEKARAGTGSRIVGFKADPELFRKYMSEKA